MSSRLVCAPERVSSCFATSRMCSRLRCASARGFRLTDGERLLAISKSQKNLYPETLSGNLSIRRHSPFYQKLAHGWEERHNDQIDEAWGHFQTCGNLDESVPNGLRHHATCRPRSLGTSTGR